MFLYLFFFWFSGRFPSFLENKCLHSCCCSASNSSQNPAFPFEELEEKLKLNLRIHKTGVINDPLGQTHSHASREHCFLLFCFARFEKWGRMDIICAETMIPLGGPSDSINKSCLIFIYYYIFQLMYF